MSTPAHSVSDFDTLQVSQGVSSVHAWPAIPEALTDGTPFLVRPPSSQPPTTPALLKSPTLLQATKHTSPDFGATRNVARRRTRTVPASSLIPDYALPTDTLENFLFPCFITINIALITIGYKYSNECPGEKMIPVYVIVSGIAGVSFDVSRILDRITVFVCEYSYSVSPLIALFLLCWFMYGNVLVVVTKSRTNLIVADSTYCNPRIYWFSVWYITFVWMFILVAFIYYINLCYC